MAKGEGRTKPLINSQRFARQSPDGLRKRVLSAIPEWERIPRKLRYALALMPVHGSFNAACEELNIKTETIPELVKKPINAIVKEWEKTGEYPAHRSKPNSKGYSRVEYLKNAEIMQQLANEMSVIALAQAESKMNANQAFKMAVDSGWFLNLEAEVEKERAYADSRIAKSLSLKNAPSNSDPALEIPVFEQEIEVDNSSSEAATA